MKMQEDTEIEVKQDFAAEDSELIDDLKYFSEKTKDEEMKDLIHRFVEMESGYLRSEENENSEKALLAFQDELSELINEEEAPLRRWKSAIQTTLKSLNEVDRGMEPIIEKQVARINSISSQAEGLVRSDQMVELLTAAISMVCSERLSEITGMTEELVDFENRKIERLADRVRLVQSVLGEREDITREEIIQACPEAADEIASLQSEIIILRGMVNLSHEHREAIQEIFDVRSGLENEGLFSDGFYHPGEFEQNAASNQKKAKKQKSKKKAAAKARKKNRRK